MHTTCTLTITGDYRSGVKAIYPIQNSCVPSARFSVVSIFHATGSDAAIEISNWNSRGVLSMSVFSSTLNSTGVLEGALGI